MIDVECFSCSIRFGITEVYHSNRREDHKNFHCPNGHINHYPAPELTEDQKQIKELEKVAQRRAESYRTLQGSMEEWKRAARICPICEERVTSAQFIETIRVKIAEHLRDEHGAKQRLRAITEKATA